MTVTEVTLCSECGSELGAPHVLTSDDCVLAHDGHADRKHGLLCARHWNWLASTLDQIEELFGLLGQVIIPGPGGDGPTGKTIDSPAPGRVAVMALTDRRNRLQLDDEDAVPNVPGVLESWLRLVDEESGHNLLPFARATFAADARGHVFDLSRPPALGDDLEHPLRWSIPLPLTLRLLRRERHWIAQQPWIDDYAADLAALHLALARGVGDSMWPKSLGPCPNCGVKLYPDTTGADLVACRKCKSSWSGVHWLRLRLVLEKWGAR
jgi:hypothetical protein